MSEIRRFGKAVLLAVIVLPTVQVQGPGVRAQAMHPRHQICQSHAGISVRQFVEARQAGHIRLAAPLWSPDFGQHYRWCLTVAQSVADRRVQVRASALKRLGDSASARTSPRGKTVVMDPRARVSRGPSAVRRAPMQATAARVSQRTARVTKDETGGLASDRIVKLFKKIGNSRKRKTSPTRPQKESRTTPRLAPANATIRSGARISSDASSRQPSSVGARQGGKRAVSSRDSISPTRFARPSPTGLLPQPQDGKGSTPRNKEDRFDKLLRRIEAAARAGERIRRIVDKDARQGDRAPDASECRDHARTASEVSALAAGLTTPATELPDEWYEFDHQAFGVMDLHGFSPTPVDGLADHAYCAGDVVAERVLQRYGQAMLDGIAAQAQDETRASERFANAVEALSRFARSLYCIDINGLHFWDHTISQFWQTIEKYPLPGMDFRQAILATWNPALLVVDAIQMGGKSEILETYELLEPQILAALESFPIDTYGAAWLDDFGTGQLVRFRTPEAFANVLSVMSDPGLLGMGLCPLAAHARKTDVLQGCGAGVSAAPACDPNDTFGMLRETGLLFSMFQSSPNLKGTQDWVTGGTEGPGGESIQVTLGYRGGYPTAIAYTAGGPALELQIPPAYFGSPLEALLQPPACEMRPVGLGKLLPERGTPQGDACIFQKVTNGLGGTEGDNPAFDCREPYASNPVKVEPALFRIPVSDCGSSTDLLEDAIMDDYRRILEALIPEFFSLGSYGPVDPCTESGDSGSDPATPDSGGCNKTAAQARARLILDCVID